MQPSHITFRWLAVTAAISLATLLALSGHAAATVQVGATSSPQPSSVFPTVTGNSSSYEFTISDGQSLTDSIPVQFCVTGEENTDWISFQVQTGQIGGGGNLPGVTLPGNLTFTSAETIVTPTSLPVCKTATIQVNTGSLTLTDPQTAQQFVKNLNISVANPNPSTGANKPQVNPTGSTEIHLRVLVKPVAANISCFITDSSGNLLTKCDGTLAEQSGSDAGRFAIVANKKNIEVATNPGQFYYNLLYHNPGTTDITVDVSFGLSSVNPKGTQAIHAALFAPPFSGITQEGFNAVNDGIPEGNGNGVQGITIRAGWTLWVDYHLEWGGLGSPVPTDCATECPTANQPFSVTGTVAVISPSGPTESCTAGARGYKK